MTILNSMSQYRQPTISNNQSSDLMASLFPLSSQAVSSWTNSWAAPVPALQNQIPSAAPVPALAPGSIFDGALQQKRSDGSTSGGYLQAGLGIAQGLGSLYMGMQQYKLAKDSLNFQKDAYNKDYTARTKDYNASIEDRQTARVASNPGAYQSVSEYMNKNRMG